MYRQKRKEVFPMDAMIEVDGLSKSFRIARRRPGLLGGMRSVVDPDARIVEAVHDLSLRIERGEMIGLIGPNGAGIPTSAISLPGKSSRLFKVGVTLWRMGMWRDLTTEAHLRVALFQRPVMADFIIFVAT